MPSSKATSFKYLVVGQGLAGTLISFQLYQRGIPHKVLDNGHKYAATKAAAGIINPVTGRRYVKSWLIDQLLPAAHQAYRAVEKLLNIELVNETQIYRTFADQSQYNAWQESTSRPGYAPYVQDSTNFSPFADLVAEPFGFGIIKQAMQINVAALINAYKNFLAEKDLLITAAFDHATFNHSAVDLRWASDTFSKVIFCEGYRVIHNPLFSDLPFQPAKGESFIVETEAVLPQLMIRDKIFMAPRSKHQFWTGGGYENHQLTEVTTEKFRTDWTAKLEELLIAPFTIKEHKSGIRPSVRGRKPLMGRHPDHPAICLFNGMGTKGTSLAPYWSNVFVKCLEEDRALPQEVCLSRFDS